MAAQDGTNKQRAPASSGAGVRVKDLMQAMDEIVHIGHKLSEAAERMQRVRVPFLPVVDGDEIVGILTARDIYHSPEAQAGETGAELVRDHVLREVAFCHENDDLETAMEAMDESGHHRLMVADENRELSGYVTREAIEAHLGEHLTGSAAHGAPTDGDHVAVPAPGRDHAPANGRQRRYTSKPRLPRG